MTKSRVIGKEHCPSEEMKEELKLDKGGLRENVPDGNKEQRGRNSEVGKSLMPLQKRRKD